jgi:hypothetical protein
LPLVAFRWASRRGNDEHGLSGFDVPEHFRQPEFVRLDDHRFFFWGDNPPADPRARVGT